MEEQDPRARNIAISEHLLPEALQWRDAAACAQQHYTISILEVRAGTISKLHLDDITHTQGIHIAGAEALIGEGVQRHGDGEIGSMTLNYPGDGIRPRMQWLNKLEKASSGIAFLPS